MLLLFVMQILIVGSYTSFAVGMENSYATVQNNPLRITMSTDKGLIIACRTLTGKALINAPKIIIDSTSTTYNALIQKTDSNKISAAQAAIELQKKRPNAQDMIFVPA